MQLMTTRWEQWTIPVLNLWCCRLFHQLPTFIPLSLSLSLGTTLARLHKPAFNKFAHRDWNTTDGPSANSSRAAAAAAMPRCTHGGRNRTVTWLVDRAIASHVAVLYMRRNAESILLTYDAGVETDRAAAEIDKTSSTRRPRQSLQMTITRSRRRSQWCQETVCFASFAFSSS